MDQPGCSILAKFCWNPRKSVKFIKMRDEYWCMIICSAVFVYDIILSSLPPPLHKETSRRCPVPPRSPSRPGWSPFVRSTWLSEPLQGPLWFLKTPHHNSVPQIEASRFRIHQRLRGLCAAVLTWRASVKSAASSVKRCALLQNKSPAFTEIKKMIDICSPPFSGGMKNRHYEKMLTRKFAPKADKNIIKHNM